MYGKKIVAIGKNDQEVSFIDSVTVSNMKKDFLINNIKDLYKTIFRSFKNFEKTVLFNLYCANKNCNEMENIEVHYICKFYRSVDKHNRIILMNKPKKISKLSAIKLFLKKKQLSLCLKHCIFWHNKILTIFDRKDEWR
jgi:hypothetical protein